MYIYADAVHRGSLQIAAGAVVSAYSGATIDFTVAGRAPEDGYLINDLSLVQGVPDFTITVASDQVTGVYRLADGAAAFDQTVSVRLTDDTTLGNITVGGELSAGGKTYTLTKEGAALSLFVIGSASPVITLTGDNTTPLQAATLTASTETETTISYSMDSVNWTAYTGALAVTANGTYYFQAKDTSGNVGVATITFDNIDTVAPEAPTVSADITSMTNQNVTVSAVFSDDSATKQYSLDEENWSDYTAGIEMSANGTVYFRGIDAAGNISETVGYTVSNIDKDAPTAPSANADVTAPTRGDVIVSAVFSDDSTTKQYSLDGENWNAYIGGVKMSDNGTVYFRGIDAVGNISDVTSYAVTNIYKSAPTAPSASADVTAPTNGNVIVSAVFSDDSATRQYRLDGENWSVYTAGVEMSANGTVYFRGINALGDISDVTSYEVTNIDKVAPEAPTASADITAVTNQNVTVTATYSSDSVKKQYSTDNQTWKSYGSGVVMSGNGTVFFRGIDAVGNISDVTSYEVTNIDKVAPAKPVVTASTKAWTNQKVILTAAYSEDSAKKQYSTDKTTWKTYSTSGVSVAANATYYFRGIDAAGNISGIAAYKVSNIDKVAPTKPVVTASTKAMTNQNVILTAAYSEDSAKKQYSTDKTTWKTYKASGISVAANATYYFRGLDKAGNISGIAAYKVSNIDKVAPTKPVVKASTTAPTNKNVTLTATYSSDSVKKQYSTDKTTWKTYKASGISVAANATYYFRGIDKAGNISGIAAYKVSNIDKVAPTKPTVKASTTAPTNQNVTLTATYSSDTKTRQYSTDKKTWRTFSTSGVSVAANATYYFRGLDAAGNISNVTSYAVTNIDKTAPERPTVKATTNSTSGRLDGILDEKSSQTSTRVTLTASYSADSVKKQYSTDNESWATYSSGIVMTSNGTVYFRGIDAAGNISAVTSYTVSIFGEAASPAPSLAAWDWGQTDAGSLDIAWSAAGTGAADLAAWSESAAPAVASLGDSVDDLQFGGNFSGSLGCWADTDATKQTRLDAGIGNGSETKFAFIA